MLVRRSVVFTPMLPADLAASVDAVANVARHFDRLQARATQLLDLFQASERGYFTPSEDEETLHLLVSYWQSRNALWEIVSSGRQEALRHPDRSPAVFIVAFAGALLLIDMARFMRTQFHHRPVVRNKLNQGEPAFGIPAGVYDRVQKSLTSPLNAWHLAHAVRYFEQQRHDLLAVSGQHAELGFLVDVIGRHVAQIDVGFRQLVRARIRVRATEIATAWKRDVVARALYGLQKAVSGMISEKYVVRGHCPNLPATVAGRVRDLLRPGDVLITRKEHALTNYFLPGFWPHAALYLGGADDLTRLGIAEHVDVAPRWQPLLTCDPSEPRRVLEALKDGVRLRSLGSPLACDAIAVLRPLADDGLIAQAIARGFSHEGKAYDFDFDFTRSDRLVCTEVVYRSFEGVGDIRFVLTRRAGRQTLAAQDLLAMGLGKKHFRIIAAYACQHADCLATDEAAEDMIGKTMSVRSHEA